MFKGARAIARGAVVMVVAVGCGGGSTGEKVAVDATAALRHAAQVTLDKSTSKVEFTMKRRSRPQGDAAGTERSTSEQGVVD